jgi:hypothetical protein
VLASFAATLGLTVLVFQGLFHEPGISWFVTPLLFIILVALGADYNIFVTSRIREELATGIEPAEAAEAGLVQTGRVITSAGLILAGTFASLLIAPLPNLRQMGFAVATGILIDTFVVRSVLVPAATVLLGDWAFWPGYQRDRGHRLEPAHVGGATAAVGTFALILVVLAATTSHAETIDRISGHRDDASVATLPAGPVSTTAPTGTQPSSTTVGQASTAQPAAPTASTTAAPSTSGLHAPAPGNWRYHLDGTRKIGLAGSTQPFSEDVTTAVSNVRSSADQTDVDLRTDSGSGTEQDRRRYSSSSIALLSTQRSGAGMSFGGTLQPPQVLLRQPAKVGDTWQTDWTTETLHGRSTSRVSGTRTVTVASSRYDCIEVTTDSTFSGDAEGSQHDVSCWITALGMIATADETFQGTFHNVPFEIHQRRALTSLPR